MTTAPHLTAYGVVMAALRGDHDATRALLVGLPAEETTEIADAALLAMGDALRAALPAEAIDDMIRTLQGFALEDSNERNPS